MEKSFLLYFAIAAVIATSYVSHAANTTHNATKKVEAITVHSVTIKPTMKPTAAHVVVTNITAINKTASTPTANETIEFEILEPIAEISLLGWIANLLESFQRFKRWLRWQQFFEPEMEEERNPFVFFGNFYNRLFGPSILPRGYGNGILVGDLFEEAMKEEEEKKPNFFENHPLSGKFSHLFGNFGFDDQQNGESEEK
ncbi:unnamed protein product [Clavelina lepadiformis]|uniref:Uncharacterized protein n=1 Tax=Clavelina lepadiformis TaxID=159417 RepID=A0ABP0FRN7_CLALP